MQTQPTLTVVIVSYPESNGKRNWTALLKRVEPFDGLIGNNGGITIAHGEYYNRVAYAADRARFLIGEMSDEPHIVDYAEDVHTEEEWRALPKRSLRIS